MIRDHRDTLLLQRTSMSVEQKAHALWMMYMGEGWRYEREGGPNYIYENGETYVWARPVRPLQGEAYWFIYVMIGDMREALSMLPFVLPGIAFERRLSGKKGRKTYSFTRLMRLIQVKK